MRSDVELEESIRETANAKELGAFLRAHRERRSPREVGLPDTGRRRTPGLRREEVAALSGVGLAWYTWLEQGRVIPSRKVLEAVARTLGLNAVSYRHVLALSGLLPPTPDGAGHDEVAARTQALLDTWETSPAVLLDARFDITAWNTAYAAVWSDPAELPADRRNLMWCLAGDPAIRTTLADWEPVGRAVLAQFRGQTARLAATDARTQEIYRVLREDFPELVGWWECQGVGDLTARQVDVRLPCHGELRLLFSAFRPVDDPEALVLVQAPAGPADHELVARLVREHHGRSAEVVRIRAHDALGGASLKNARSSA
ncbi:helix-turn-helix domain-containing protein [Streptomyces fulvoviolaceus]|uniref:helix-turn-helix domain-containing protein n=1 Tax=Streptomyces fulvoviolaceus TaxID=285535 RepID=UPI001F38B3DD|nr:helix-turn-helix domain-containing protein [Streptomyces fulvoviolaceus]